MPYNEDIEKRIEAVISNWENTDSKKMFGGVCHLMRGNMFCGVHKDFLIVRLGKDSAEKALVLPHVKPFDITGRPMKAWVMVAQEAFSTEGELVSWLNQARDFASTLPPK